MATAEALLTAEEYGAMSDDRRTELVRGEIIELSRPGFIHGHLIVKVALALMNVIDAQRLGRLAVNDSGVVTRRDPDTVRGADLAYYSYARMPREVTPKLYPDVAPDLVIEVRSPSDRWRDIHIKVSEYLSIGVQVVCALDPEPMAAHLFYPDQQPRTLGPDDELAFPECLGEFRVAVRRLFE